MKDQSKKVANMKHKEQLEKSRNTQLMEEAKMREDNLNESSQQIKVPRRRRRKAGSFGKFEKKFLSMSFE